MIIFFTQNFESSLLIKIFVEGSKCFLYIVNEGMFSRTGAVGLQLFLHRISGQAYILKP